MSPERPMRADAVRNRRNILDAAQKQIGERGPEVGMDEIAKAAGVAVGTLYRHFPTKADLLAAVISEYVAQVADDAQASLTRAENGATVVDEVIGFLERVVESSAHTHAVKAAAKNLGVQGQGVQSDETRAGAALAELIALGQRAGDIRPEIGLDDFYLLMATLPTDQPAEVRRRWLRLVLPGIATRA